MAADVPLEPDLLRAAGEVAAERAAVGSERSTSWSIGSDHSGSPNGASAASLSRGARTGSARRLPAPA